MSAPVFLADASVAHPLAGYAPGSVYVLDGAEGRHAGVVQRRGPGERIDVVDGAGVRLRTVVESVDGAGVHLRVEDVEVEPEPAVVVTLVQALAKGDRDEMAIEAATEVGADAVLPWQAERSVVVWRGDRAARSRARWVSTVRAATKQARRARMPSVGTALSTKQLAARAREVVEAGGVVTVLHEEASTPLADVPLPEAGELLVVVGPEGGISDGEVAALTEAGAVTARLGPHVLRTSTAGPVAIALLSARLGRWS
ncbi:16S rRNA (uracil(1498)-N(3))-methyltransferase [Promicromonospora thailandica]|uniref:Ribosomal RNA small subunit methyltransferase E n=1 Tax=Promicromonospora thailandica TaxID=765201 RepID=A0A9X2G913_9MICO|nr:16S rRNA (uracil(1498)-N(3))-methyltransferase [Promicromonospora thailandica]MCP2264186.1 16S rRNA (uracil1498-N3)-methyltransferase [Promicromonospora thailandica]BFF21147.1 16S rRNA (uracil(1498)-N(3))-methyltransferase [Promicromonospora thailandica]